VDESSSDDDNATNKTYHSLIDGEILSNYKEARSMSMRTGLKKSRSIAKIPFDIEKESALKTEIRERFESYHIPASTTMYHKL
jgi:hypothetical protein